MLSGSADEASEREREHEITPPHYSREKSHYQGFTRLIEGKERVARSQRSGFLVRSIWSGCGSICSMRKHKSEIILASHISLSRCFRQKSIAEIASM